MGYLEEGERCVMMAAVKSDSMFLRDQGIMDYSLLLGLKSAAYKTLERQPSAYSQSVRRATLVVGPTRYYFAIIDILQKYDFSKQLERLAKCITGKDTDGISVVEPTKYQQRFVTGVEQILATAKEMLVLGNAAVAAQSDDDAVARTVAQSDDDAIRRG